MAVAAMFDSGYQAFCDVIDVLLINAATLLPNWVKIGRKMIERQRFFEIQDGGSRHVEFRLQGASLYHSCVVYQSCYIPTKFSENWFKKMR